MVKRIALTLIILAALAFSGCSFLMPTPEATITEYFAAVNAGSWNLLYTYMHPDMGDRDELKDGQAILAPLYDQGEGTVLYLITETSGNTFTISVTYPVIGDVVEETFVMEQEEDSLFSRFLIRSFSANGQTFD